MVVLERDSYVCQLVLPGCTHAATQVHHTVGKEHGDNPRYLVAACASCNAKTGMPQGDPPLGEPRTKW